MKKVITVAVTKGGSGKSTIALNLAIELGKKHNVRLLDLDYQKSATLFNRIRTNEGHEPLEMLTAETVKDIQKIIKANTGILIIDTGAFDSDNNRTAIRLADKIITPTSDTEIDIYGLLMFNEYLLEIKKAKPSLKACVLMNRLKPKATGKEIISQVEANKKTMTLMKTIIHERNEYAHLFAKGTGATEAKRKTAASEEIAKLAKEVLK